MNKDNKIYKFWVGTFRYRGTITDETETHWIIFDIKLNKIVDIPKGTAVREEE